jgi:hypothetical protein
MKKDDDKSFIIGFLDMVCVKYGIHIPLQNKRQIAESWPIDPNKLADAVLRAGGIDPEMEIKLSRQIRNAYIDACNNWDKPKTLRLRTTLNNLTPSEAKVFRSRQK